MTNQARHYLLRTADLEAEVSTLRRLLSKVLAASEQGHPVDGATVDECLVALGYKQGEQHTGQHTNECPACERFRAEVERCQRRGGSWVADATKDTEPF